MTVPSECAAVGNQNLRHPVPNPAGLVTAISAGDPAWMALGDRPRDEPFLAPPFFFLAVYGFLLVPGEAWGWVVLCWT